MTVANRLFVYTCVACAIILYTGCAGVGSARTDNSSGAVNAEDIALNPSVRLADLVRQRVPGIQITESAEGGIQIRMRGAMSFTADTAPLFVVDDVPVCPAFDGSLPGVLISEIASINVYKDPSDTLRWGMRGANGVIVVKTKLRDES